MDFFKLLSQKNIIFSDISIKEIDLSFVLRVLANSMNQLVQRSDTGATSNEANLSVLVSSPRVLANGTLERNSITRAEAKDMVSKLAGLVSLDQELEASISVKVRDGGVGSNNGRTIGINELGQEAGSIS